MGGERNGAAELYGGVYGATGSQKELVQDVSGRSNEFSFQQLNKMTLGTNSSILDIQAPEVG